MRIVTAEEFATLPDGIIFRSERYDQITVKGVPDPNTHPYYLIYGSVDSLEEWDENEYQVWEKADIEALIATLNKALEVCEVK